MSQIGTSQIPKQIDNREKEYSRIFDPYTEIPDLSNIVAGYTGGSCDLETLGGSKCWSKLGHCEEYCEDHISEMLYPFFERIVTNHRTNSRTKPGTNTDYHLMVLNKHDQLEQATLIPKDENKTKVNQTTINESLTLKFQHPVLTKIKFQTSGSKDPIIEIDFKINVEQKELLVIMNRGNFRAKPNNPMQYQSSRVKQPTRNYSSYKLERINKTTSEEERASEYSWLYNNILVPLLYYNPTTHKLRIHMDCVFGIFVDNLNYEQFQTFLGQFNVMFQKQNSFPVTLELLGAKLNRDNLFGLGDLIDIGHAAIKLHVIPNKEAADGLFYYVTLTSGVQIQFQLEPHVYGVI